jgi:aspartyl protease family protein
MDPIMCAHRFILILLLYFSAFCATAADIQIMGLFKNKVIMHIDGKRTVLSVGEKTSDGIEVLDANSKDCTLLIDGEKQTFELGTQMSVKFSKDSTPQVRIAQDPQGMYRHQGKINDAEVKFLVDTGASLVALNINQAKELNLELKQDAITEVQTASGKARAYNLILRKVSIGDIMLYDVPAVVVDGNSPNEILLGMSFLQHLNMNDKDKTLELSKKF